jgi:hypothetical protein
MLYIFLALMLIIASVAFADHQYFIGSMAMILSMAGIFIYKNYYYPKVMDWVNRWF